MRGQALALLAVILLAGCSGGSDSTETGTGPGTTSSSGAKVQTGPGTITVYLNRTSVDGPAPLEVDFTLAATFKGTDGKAAHPTSSVLVTYRQTEDANGTALTAAAQNGPSVPSLPATFSLTFPNAGKYEVVATVKSKDYKDGKATVLVLPRVPGSGGLGGSPPIFFDGAEGDTSQWTLSAKVAIIDFNGVVPITVTDVDHPTGKWVISDKEAHEGTHSFWSDYPDNYRGRMVSLPITVPGDGGKLSFWYKGGAEANGYDGLFVYANDGEVQGNLAGPAVDWTKVSVNVPGGDVTLEFRFDSDPSCSAASGPPAGCGDGWDAGGFYVDEITVA